MGVCSSQAEGDEEEENYQIDYYSVIIVDRKIPGAPILELLHLAHMIQQLQQRVGFFVGHVWIWRMSVPMINRENGNVDINTIQIEGKEYSDDSGEFVISRA